MLPFGILLMVIGMVVGVVSVGGGMLGLALGLPLGGSLFSIGFFVALAGAILNAIEEHRKAVVAEMRGAREDLRIGFKSLWDELDTIRAHTEPQPLVPVYGTTPIATSGN